MCGQCDGATESEGRGQAEHPFLALLVNTLILSYSPSTHSTMPFLAVVAKVPAWLGTWTHYVVQLVLAPIEAVVCLLLYALQLGRSATPLAAIPWL